MLHVLKGDNELRVGDVVVVSSGGGGGYGRAWERELDAVRRDLALGYVSKESAQRDYGVAFKDTTIDVAETSSRRVAMKEASHAE